ncbi:MAG: hypothetical protein QM626_02585 [Microbacterium sp.]|uniref:hypothetical protein n=1 Tax=Microbacterium sp. TaxID=51671 RepID=UPI0039E5DB9B
MDILLAFIFGVALGLIAHFALPGRDTRGVVLLPGVGAIVGGLVWLGLTWVGATTTDPWIWLLSIVVPAIVVVPVGSIVTRVRSRRDARVRERLRLS